jgi:hypothetical protein
VSTFAKSFSLSSLRSRSEQGVDVDGRRELRLLRQRADNVWILQKSHKWAGRLGSFADLRHKINWHMAAISTGGSETVPLSVLWPNRRTLEDVGGTMRGIPGEEASRPLKL